MKIFFVAMALLLVALAKGQEQACPSGSLCQSFQSDPSLQNYNNLPAPTYRDFSRLSPQDQDQLIGSMDLAKARNMEVAHGFFSDPAKSSQNIIRQQDKFRDYIGKNGVNFDMAALDGPKVSLSGSTLRGKNGDIDIRHFKGSNAVVSVNNEGVISITNGENNKLEFEGALKYAKSPDGSSPDSFSIREGKLFGKDIKGGENIRLLSDGTVSGESMRFNSIEFGDGEGNPASRDFRFNQEKNLLTIQSEIIRADIKDGMLLTGSMSAKVDGNGDFYPLHGVRVGENPLIINGNRKINALPGKDPVQVFFDDEPSSGGMARATLMFMPEWVKETAPDSFMNWLREKGEQKGNVYIVENINPAAESHEAIAYGDGMLSQRPDQRGFKATIQEGTFVAFSIPTIGTPNFAGGSEGGRYGIAESGGKSFRGENGNVYLDIAQGSARAEDSADIANIPRADASSGQMVSVRPEAMTLSFLRSAAASEQPQAPVTISPAKEGYQLGDIYKKRLCEGQKYRAENPATCSRFD